MRHWTILLGGSAIAISLCIAAPSFAATSPVHTVGPTTTMEATAYGPSAVDNYPYGATDYFGQPLTAGDIAVDPSRIPLGSCVKVTGYRSANLPAGTLIGEADDEGDAIHGDHIDIYLNASPTEVSNFGIQSVNVMVLGPASNLAQSGTQACSSYQAAAMVRTSFVRKVRRNAAKSPTSNSAHLPFAITLNTIPSGIRRR